MKRTFAILTLASLAGALSGFGYAGEKRKPNVLLILVDDLGYAKLGCTPSPLYPFKALHEK